MKSTGIVDTDKLGIRPMASADINLAAIYNVKYLQTQNKYLSYAVVILGIAVFGFWYYASLKDAPSTNRQYLSEPEDNSNIW